MIPVQHNGLIALADAERVDPESVGGKARGLARLLAWGFPVPDGFVVPAAFDLGDPTALETLSAHLSKLGSTDSQAAYAVRSSAPGEDSGSASWAGQFETKLSVKAADVADAVLKCRASLANQRPAGYAHDHNLNVPSRMAVVVQRMVDAVVSGTVYSRGLVAGDALAVEAIGGLGEALLAGEITPATFSIDRASLAVSRLNTVDLGDVLELEQLREIARTALTIERQAGRAMDIEWSMDATGTVFVVQARPVTATADSEGRPYAEWDPSTLFRWGPTDGRFFYISDYVTASCAIGSVTDGATLPWTVLAFDDSALMVWLCTHDGWYGLADHCFEDICLDDEKYEALRERYATVLPRLERHLGLGWNALGQAELAEAGRALYEDMEEFWLCTLPSELAKYGGGGVIDRILSAEVPHDDVRAAIVEMLYEPHRLTVDQRRRIELFEATDLSAFWERHRWALSSYLGPRERPLAEFEDERARLSEADIADLTAAVHQQVELRSQTTTTLGLPEPAVRAGRRLAEVVDWQEERKLVANRMMAAKAAFLQASAKALATNEEDLRSLGHYEITSLLDGDDDPRAALGKRAGFIFQRTVERIAPSEARMLWDSFAQPPLDVEERDAFEGGLVACVAPAPLTGIARVIREPSAIDDFVDGEILVVPSTRPHWEELMRRASAVISDEAGLTNHTATYCRENHLPGIVGVGNATRRIRDGQQITVYADKRGTPGRIVLHR